MSIHCVRGGENHLSVLMSINLLAADVIRRHPGATNMAQPPTVMNVFIITYGASINILVYIFFTHL